MKKVLVGLGAMLLVAGMAVSASATTFTDTQTLNVTLGEGLLAQLFVADNTVSYTHNTPADFEVPYDTVNSASLTISGYWIDDNNDEVAVEGTAVGFLTEGGDYEEPHEIGHFQLVWHGWFPSLEWVVDGIDPGFDDPSVSTFDIASTFTSWTAGSPIGVTITANGGLLDGLLKINTSTFELDYENGTAPDNGTAPAPTPEPATMLLFGTGLAGLVGARRRTMKKA
jgi:hypothetical protein